MINGERPTRCKCPTPARQKTPIGKPSSSPFVWPCRGNRLPRASICTKGIGLPAATHKRSTPDTFWSRKRDSCLSFRISSPGKLLRNRVRGSKSTAFLLFYTISTELKTHFFSHRYRCPRLHPAGAPKERRKPVVGGT